jgi:hypothetical protein
MKSAGNYAKSLVPLLITALYSIQAALSDGKVTNTEWAGIATGLLASLGAYLVPNTKPPAPVVASPSVNINSAPGVTVTTSTGSVNANSANLPTTEPAPPIL